MITLEGTVVAYLNVLPQTLSVGTDKSTEYLEGRITVRTYALVRPKRLV
jgi:hypothetical protein